ncbi:hypothetical protein BROC_01975 [Candidatus Brocadiaceae bacterium]|nr:hypothetical protein BROC_01975 [Candidatus Brocadiaceae bacterium]
MTKMIENLLENSGLPGPRGNLELLHSFTKNATANEINECLTFYKDDLINSPEEFVVMCGVVGLCIQNKNDIKGILRKIRSYASHNSWRIRESVAIGIQEIAEKNMSEIILNLKKWMDGNDFEKRAIVAALCEPKLLKEKSEIIEILEILHKITIGFEKINGKLSDSQNSLRKTLGYGWSVAIVSLPNEGKFEKEEINCNG